MDAKRSPEPLHITMHERDNVAIVVNDGGLPAGAVFASGLALREHVPQGHKVALVDLPEGGAVRRYDVTIGYALRDIPAGRPPSFTTIATLSRSCMVMCSGGLASRVAVSMRVPSSGLIPA